MKHLRQRNARIAEELILFVYRYGAENIQLNINTKDNLTEINITSNCFLTDDILESINLLLSTDRSKELEEYYWNLSGESNTDCELSLIGVMTDEAIISYDKLLNILKIKLIRLI